MDRVCKDENIYYLPLDRTSVLTADSELGGMASDLGSSVTSDRTPPASPHVTEQETGAAPNHRLSESHAAPPCSEAPLTPLDHQQGTLSTTALLSLRYADPNSGGDICFPFQYVLLEETGNLLSLNTNSGVLFGIIFIKSKTWTRHDYK